MWVTPYMKNSEALRNKNNLRMKNFYNVGNMHELKLNSSEMKM